MEIVNLLNIILVFLVFIIFVLVLVYLSVVYKNKNTKKAEEKSNPQEPKPETEGKSAEDVLAERVAKSKDGVIDLSDIHLEKDICASDIEGKVDGKSGELRDIKLTTKIMPISETKDFLLKNGFSDAEIQTLDINNETIQKMISFVKFAIDRNIINEILEGRSIKEGILEFSDPKYAPNFKNAHYFTLYEINLKKLLQYKK